MVEKRSRRRILQVVGAGLSTSLAGCASVIERVSDEGKTNSDRGTTVAVTPSRTTPSSNESSNRESADSEPTMRPLEIESPDVSFSSVPLPDEPGKHQYARMGPTDAPTVTVFGNWKCPYTQGFVLGQLNTLVEEFIEPGRLGLEFRCLAYRSDHPFLGPDAPRAARAGLAVWKIDPDSYWNYFKYVFANQPQERFEWATKKNLVKFAEAANVGGIDRIKSRVTEKTDRAAVQATTQTALKLSVFSVPRVVANGTVTAPTVSPESTRAQLERAARGSGST